MIRKNSKGFTLAELLVVVAIIAVLVAFAIPAMTNTLEKAREATELANLRNAYSMVMSAGLDTTLAEPISDPRGSSAGWDAYVGKVVSFGGYCMSAVKIIQQENGWQTGSGAIPPIGNTDSEAIKNVNVKDGYKYWYILYDCHSMQPFLNAIK